MVWESLAILEFLAEAHPEAGLGPRAAKACAHARALAAEMHAGFADPRQHCPMDVRARRPMAALPDAVAAEVRRIVALVLDGDGTVRAYVDAVLPLPAMAAWTAAARGWPGVR